MKVSKMNYKVYQINGNEKIIVYRKRTKKGIKYITTYYNPYDGELVFGVGSTAYESVVKAEKKWRESYPKSPNPFEILLNLITYNFF